MTELIVTPFSHFCEKARWGLEHGGVRFRERKVLPMVHLPVVRWALRRSDAGESDAHRPRGLRAQPRRGAADPGRVRGGDFAALLAPLVLPTDYGAVMPDPERFGAEVRELIRTTRDHPAGALALELYRQHRTVS